MLTSLQSDPPWIQANCWRGPSVLTVNTKHTVYSKNPVCANLWLCQWGKHHGVFPVDDLVFMSVKYEFGHIFFYIYSTDDHRIYTTHPPSIICAQVRQNKLNYRQRKWLQEKQFQEKRCWTTRTHNEKVRPWYKRLMLFPHPCYSMQLIANKNNLCC